MEEENATLQAEYERLRSKQTPGSTPEEVGLGENDMIAEAKLLREHKGRLEARMQILEDHNRQLEAQLQRLRQLLDEVNIRLEVEEEKFPRMELMLDFIFSLLIILLPKLELCKRVQ